MTLGEISNSFRSFYPPSGFEDMRIVYLTIRLHAVEIPFPGQLLENSAKARRNICTLSTSPNGSAERRFQPVFCIHEMSRPELHWTYEEILILEVYSG